MRYCLYFFLSIMVPNQHRMSLLDDYQLLEIPTNATEQEAKVAFRKLARRYHPDKNPNHDTTEVFQRLQAAYENVQGAIRLGDQVVDWQPFTFTQENTHSSGAKNRYQHFSSASDKQQAAFVKERQRAYEEMKRNNAQHEKTREEAIKSARNALNEKRVKALYEKAFKASAGSQQDSSFDSQRHTEPFEPDHATATTSSIPPYQTFVDQSDQNQRTPFRLNAAKAAFRVTTYLACFAAGVYATLHWQSSTNSAQTQPLSSIPYISGLYPQYRVGAAYTLNITNLYAEPDTQSTSLQTMPALSELESIQLQGDWLTVRYQGINGWVQAKYIGYGTANQAQKTGCIGQPGLAPKHGALLGDAQGNSRLRILNQLPQHSKLTFESYDGRAPFSIYLYAKQAYAANYIPRGNYRLVLETGSLYHQACNQFLFNDTTQVILDPVDFASTEQTLTLTP
ncbi:DnaJ domain-containing protein [Marinomonas algarum]|uniref:DnaJ domain-containing protein n=1 Tax=Marinomonas algarum TaxID=2883105 RepID=A0A9X1LF87_9GAMM|nr:DnaJ domain-containing protein [Marinomonas algarum]MCB5162791.1 DnaJ domain-containing protein [Marinomonas algarum]